MPLEEMRLIKVQVLTLLELVAAAVALYVYHLTLIIALVLMASTSRVSHPVVGATLPACLVRVQLLPLVLLALREQL